MDRFIRNVFFIELCLYPFAIFTMNNADYVIKINDANNYYLWLRAKASVPKNSVIYLKVNGGNLDSLTFTDSEQFNWKRTINTYFLASGSHKFLL